MNHGSCMCSGGQGNRTSGKDCRCEKTDGLNMHMTVAKHLREKTHPSMWVVTIREVGVTVSRFHAALVDPTGSDDLATFTAATAPTLNLTRQLHHRSSQIRQPRTTPLSDPTTTGTSYATMPIS